MKSGIGTEQLRRRIQNGLEHAAIFEDTTVTQNRNPNGTIFTPSAGASPTPEREGFARRLRRKIVVDYLPKMQLTTYRSLVRAYEALNQVRRDAQILERERDEAAALLRQVAADRDRLITELAARSTVDQSVVQELEDRAGQLQAQVNLLRVELDKVIAQRDLAQVERDLVTGQRDQASAQRDQLLIEKTQLQTDRERVVSERDELARALPQLAAERDSLAATLAQIAAQRDELNRTLSAVTEERGRMVDHYLGIVTERDRTISTLTQQLTRKSTALPNFITADVETAPHNLSSGYQALDTFLKSEPITAENEADQLYNAIEIVMRGSPEAIRARQVEYLEHLPRLVGSEHPVVDIGCGRGEFLAVLRSRGIRAVGVDTNAVLIDTLRADGFDAVHADALDYLRGLPDASVAGFTAFQVIEHLPPDTLRALLKLMHAKLIDGGFVLLETVNPLCLDTFRSYYLDPTHLNPVPKDLLAVLLRFYGFDGLRAFYQNPVDAFEHVPAEAYPLYYQTYAVMGVKNGR